MKIQIIDIIYKNQNGDYGLDSKPDSELCMVLDTSSRKSRKYILYNFHDKNVLFIKKPSYNSVFNTFSTCQIENLKHDPQIIELFDKTLGVFVNGLDKLIVGRHQIKNIQADSNATIMKICEQLNCFSKDGKIAAERNQNGQN